MKDRITVITVCRNAAGRIAATMRSVLDQSFEDLEYIVVDGKSEDGTVAVARETARGYPRRDVKITSEPDRGIYDAMNKGLRMATGEWVCMMNAGDCFASGNVLRDVFRVPPGEDVSFLYSDLYKKTRCGKSFRVCMHCDGSIRRVVHQCVIYRRRLHSEYGYYAVTPKLIISDYLFFLQVPAEQIRKTDTVIAVYEGAGVSETGTWCKKQALCADVVFRNRSFWLIQLDFAAWRIRTCLPRRIRERLRLMMSGAD